jgi:hypothetical protein
MEIYDVVTKLVGPIHPVGAEHIDPGRLENLKTTIALVDKLLCDISTVASDNSGRQEHSRQRAGKLASEFLVDVATAP